MRGKVKVGEEIEKRLKELEKNVSSGRRRKKRTKAS